MIEIDYNAPENKLYMQIDRGVYCEAMNELVSSFAFYDNCSLRGWVCSGNDLNYLLGAVKLWLSWNERDNSKISVIAM